MAIDVGHPSPFSDASSLGARRLLRKSKCIPRSRNWLDVLTKGLYLFVVVLLVRGLRWIILSLCVGGGGNNVCCFVVCSIEDPFWFASRSIVTFFTFTHLVNFCLKQCLLYFMCMNDDWVMDNVFSMWGVIGSCRNKFVLGLQPFGGTNSAVDFLCLYCSLYARVKFCRYCDH